MSNTETNSNLEYVRQQLKNDRNYCKQMYTHAHELRKTVEDLERIYKDNYVLSLLMLDTLNEYSEEAQK
jgi:hypothetical protein